MKAGLLRHLVRVQKRVLVSDGQGGSKESWTTIDEVHAQIVQATGTEMTHGGQLTYSLSYRVSMRWRGDLTPAQRVIWEDGDTSNRILDVISSSNPDGTRRELQLICIERTPGPGPIGT